MPELGVFDRTGNQLAIYILGYSYAISLLDPNNPYADYTIIVALYCSGDTHAGNVTQSYTDSAGVPVVQVGYYNAQVRLSQFHLKYFSQPCFSFSLSFYGVCPGLGSVSAVSSSSEISPVLPSHYGLLSWEYRSADLGPSGSSATQMDFCRCCAG